MLNTLILYCSSVTSTDFKLCLNRYFRPCGRFRFRITSLSWWGRKLNQWLFVELVGWGRCLLDGQIQLLILCQKCLYNFGRSNMSGGFIFGVFIESGSSDVAYTRSSVR